MAKRDYIKGKAMQLLQRTGRIDGKAYKTLQTILGDSTIKASLEDSVINCYNAGFENDRFISFDAKGKESAVYTQNCISGRNELSLVKILVEQGYDVDVYTYDKQTESQKKMAAINPQDKYVDIFMNDNEQEPIECMTKFSAMGYDIRVWVGGEKPLVALNPVRKEGSVQRSHNNHYLAAQSAIQAAIALGYSLNL